MGEQLEDKITFRMDDNAEYTFIDYANVCDLAYYHTDNPLSKLARDYCQIIGDAYTDNNYMRILESEIHSSIYGIDEYSANNNSENQWIVRFRYPELFKVFSNHAPYYCNCDQYCEVSCSSDHCDDFWEIIDKYIFRRHGELIYNEKMNSLNPIRNERHTNGLLKSIADLMGGTDTRTDNKPLSNQLDKQNQHNRLTCYTLYDIYHDERAQLHGAAKYCFEDMASDYDVQSEEFLDNNCVLSLFGVTYGFDSKYDTYIFNFYDSYIWDIIKDKLPEGVKVNNELCEVEEHINYEEDNPWHNAHVLSLLRHRILHPYVEWFREYERNTQSASSAGLSPEDVIQGIRNKIREK